jgi:hypothetical protein
MLGLLLNNWFVFWAMPLLLTGLAFVVVEYIVRKVR